jgi:hypothetical protein
VLAIAFAGVGMAARGAEPGDALWGLSKVLYADHARSVEAAKSVRTDLNEAQQALEQGQIDEAKDALEAAGTELSNVSTEDGKDVLKAEHEELLEQLTSNPVPPPLPSQRSDTAKPSSQPSSATSPTPSSTPSQSSSNSPSTPPSSISSVTPPSGSVAEEPPRSDTPNLPGNGPVNGGVSTNGNTPAGTEGTN